MIVVGTSHSHGDEKHDKEMSSHMQAMYALKEQVPEDYRIMERTPIIPDKESLTGGAEFYRRLCAACHGEYGQGDGPAAAGLVIPPANFKDLEHSNIYGPGEKFWIIGNGSGEAAMPAFRQLNLINRWNIVNFIYELQKPSKSRD